jgi:hypothetical protein
LPTTRRPRPFLSDRVEQAIQIVQVGRIALHAGHIPADQLDGFVQRFLPPARDEDMRSFVYEQLGAGQRERRARDRQVVTADRRQPGDDDVARPAGGTGA